MPAILGSLRVAYGAGWVEWTLPEGSVATEVAARPSAPAKDPLGVVAAALDAPLGDGPRLEQLARGASSVAIVVPDRTRAAPASTYLLPVLARLARAGVPPRRMHVVIARGIHAVATRDDVVSILGEEVMAALRPIQSAPDTTESNATLFEDPRLGEVRVHRAVAQADVVLLTGIVRRHHLAGHGGGAKGLVPGVAERGTVLAAHRLTLDALVRPDGSIAPAAGTRANSFAEALVGVVERVGRAHVLDIVPADDGTIHDAVAGQCRAAHTEAVRRYETRWGEPSATAPADLVVVGAGGARGADLVQAHKALLAALPYAKPGAPIVWLAQAERGPGHPEFLAWFESGSLERHLQALRTHFHPYGLTAYSVRRIARDHPVHVASAMSKDLLRPMGLLPHASPQQALDQGYAEATRLAGGPPTIVVLPNA